MIHEKCFGFLSQRVKSKLFSAVTPGGGGGILVSLTVFMTTHHFLLAINVSFRVAHEEIKNTAMPFLCHAQIDLL